MDGIRHTKLLADANCSGILDFAVPWNSTGSLQSRIEIDAMVSSFPQQKASVPLKVSD